MMVMMVMMMMMMMPFICHYRNRHRCQVVEYQYKPEYLARFNAGEREKMEKRQTGVIAQVAHLHRRRRCRHSQQQQHHH